MITREQMLYEAGSMESLPEAISSLQEVTIDGIFYINPDGAEDRRRHMEAQSVITDVKFTRMRGPYYSKETLQKTFSECLNRQHWGTVNCGLGHLRVMNQAYDMGLSTICILEDDVYLKQNFKAELLECVRQLNEHDPDWLICNLADPDPRRDTETFIPRRGSVTDYLIHGGEVWGCGGYLLSRKGMEHFKDQYMTPDAVVPIDCKTYHTMDGSYAWKIHRPRTEQVVLYHQLDTDNRVIAENSFFFGSIRSNGM